VVTQLCRIMKRKRKCMRVQLRIVAGALRGRKLTCTVNPNLRPTPDMVRESLFNILGDAVTDRLFVDVFAGSGVVGVEALSRGAKSVLFIERDLRLAQEIDRHLKEFNYARQARVLRTDAYRWAAGWAVPAEPVNVFVSPPFKDIQERTADMVTLIQTLQGKLPLGSVLIFQSERHSELEGHSVFQAWDERRYGRNVLLLWYPQASTGAAD
jgi:16S rRNA (guanine966-N2)-methyltransferase